MPVTKNDEGLQQGVAQQLIEKTELKGQNDKE